MLVLFLITILILFFAMRTFSLVGEPIFYRLEDMAFFSLASQSNTLMMAFRENEATERSPLTARRERDASLGYV